MFDEQKICFIFVGWRTFFYNNLGIHAVIIYFCFVLIDLINSYKIVCTMVFIKIVCIMVFYTNCYFAMVFMWIVFFRIIVISMKRGVLRFVSMLFVNIWKSDEQKSCVRNFKIRKYAFFDIWKSDEQKNCVRNFKIGEGGES